MVLSNVILVTSVRLLSQIRAKHLCDSMPRASVTVTPESVGRRLLSSLRRKASIKMDPGETDERTRQFED
jgi:hypothetical protein